MHVEFYNAQTSHCYYVVNENGEPRIQIYHKETYQNLTDFTNGMPIGEVFAIIRPMVDRLMAEVNNTDRWHIRFFEMSGTPYSLTRGVNVFEELVTGDLSFVDGIRREVQFHPLWAVNH